MKHSCTPIFLEKTTAMKGHSWTRVLHVPRPYNPPYRHTDTVGPASRITARPPDSLPWSGVPTHRKAEFFIKAKTMSCHDVCIGLQYNGVGDTADRMFAEELGAGAKHSGRVSSRYGGGGAMGGGGLSSLKCQLPDRA